MIYSLTKLIALKLTNNRGYHQFSTPVLKYFKSNETFDLIQVQEIKSNKTFKLQIETSLNYNCDNVDIICCKVIILCRKYIFAF